MFTGRHVISFDFRSLRHRQVTGAFERHHVHTLDFDGEAMAPEIERLVGEL